MGAMGGHWSPTPHCIISRMCYQGLLQICRLVENLSRHKNTQCVFLMNVIRSVITSI